MRVTVTGAGGYIGGALLLHLLDRDLQVSALSRTTGQLGALHKSLTVIVGDVRDAEALDNLVSRSDAVVHLAAFVHREANSQQDIDECFDVNVNGTRQLIKAIKRSGHQQHIVFISTVAVYGSSFSMVDEGAPCQPATPYAQSKLQAEQQVMGAIKGGAITGCVLRAAMVFGPGAPGNLDKLMRLMRQGFFPVVEDGQNAKSMVHVDDLVAVIVWCLTHSTKSNGRVYNVAAEAPLTMRQIGDALARGFGHSPIYIPLSRWAVRFAGRLSHLASQLSGQKLPDLSRTVEPFCTTTTVDTSALQSDFSFQFRCTEGALAETALDFSKRTPHAGSVS